MTTQTFRLALQIGATIGRSFASSVRGSQTQLNRLGGSIDKLRGQQRSIEKFQFTNTQLNKTRVDLKRASAEFAQLKKSINATQEPSKQLQANFDRAKQKVERLSTAVEKQRTKLGGLRRELDQAGVSTRGLDQDSRRLGSTIGKLNTQFAKLNAARDRQRNLRSRRNDLRGELFDAVAIGATIAAPINIAVDFEQSIAKLGAITSASDETLSKMESTARRLGETTQFTASNAASAMTFLGMAGFQTNQILAATPGVLSLAQAAGSELGETADIASNILSGFSFEATEMGRVGDVLSETFTSSNTTLQSLAQSLKFAAPIANTAGASLEQVSAMAGLLGNVGIKGSMAGTTLRATFLRLSAPTGVAANTLNSLGIELTDLEGNLRPVPELLKELAEATEELGSAEQTEAIKKIFGEEAASGVSELLKQAASGKLASYITQLNAAEGATERLSTRMTSTTKGALKRLGSALESIAISVGNTLLPTIASGAAFFAGIANQVSAFAETFPTLTKLIVGTTVGLLALKVVAVAGAFGITFLSGGVLTLVTAYRTLATGLILAQAGLLNFNILSSLTAAKIGVVTAAQWAWNFAMTANPIGLIVAGVGALISVVALVVKHWGPIAGFFGGIWSSIKEITGATVSWLIDKVKLLFQPLSLIKKIGSVIAGLLGDDNDINDSSPQPTNQRRRSALVGAAIAAQPAVSLANVEPPAIPDIAPENTQLVNQSMQITAPITINAQPGMDEQAIAQQVMLALQEREQQALFNRRTNLFDDVD